MTNPFTPADMNPDKEAVSIGGDSDTIAAIAGSFAEAYYEAPKPLAAKACIDLNNFQTSCKRNSRKWQPVQINFHFSAKSDDTQIKMWYTVDALETAPADLLASV